MQQKSYEKVIEQRQKQLKKTKTMCYDLVIEVFRFSYRGVTRRLFKCSDMVI